LEEYVAFNDVYNIKSFKNIISQIKEDLESSRYKSENNNEDGQDEKEEFEKEMSSKKKIDILKYYSEFSNKKRERNDNE
jgi:DNA-binding LacI/PurR family transcriptional regulator